MKTFIPTVIISFTLGFACNEFFSDRDSDVEMAEPAMVKTTKNNTSQIKTTDQIPPDTSNHKNVIDPDFTVKATISQKPKPLSELSVREIIDLVSKNGMNNVESETLQETIANLSLAEQTAFHADIIRQLPNKKLHGLLSLVTNNIITQEPALLVELIRASQPEGSAIVAMQGFTTLAQQDLQDAWHLASSLGPGSQEQLLNHNELRSTRYNMLSRLSKDTSNLYELLDFVSTIKGRDRLTYLGAVVSSSAREDLISTRQHIMALPAGESKTRAVSSVMRVWSNENANEAMDWLMNNPGVADKYTVINSAEQLLKQGGKQTFSDYYQYTESNKLKVQLASAAAKHYAPSDIEQSINWLKKLDNPRDQSTAVYSTLRELGYEQNMAEHIQLLDNVYSGDTSQQVKYSYRYALTKWNEYEPEQVKAYVETLPAEQTELKNYLKDKLKL